MKKLLLLVACVLPLSLQAETLPKNIIVMIGDGMGLSQTSAYRYYMDDKNTPELENIVLDDMHVSIMTVNPDNPDNRIITDSAAAGTALATGQKTYVGGLSVDTEGNHLETLLQKAKKAGKSVGFAVTSGITDATPAAFSTSNAQRNNHDEIADSYFDNEEKLDLIFGGGLDILERDDRNLVKEFQEIGYSLVTNQEELDNLTQVPALGLFSERGGLPSLFENEGPNLQDMTTKALELLSQNENGFVLMIEGSQIDHAGHANDVQYFFEEMIDFMKSVEIAKDFVQENGETLMIVTGDHETGGLALAGEGDSFWHGHVLRNTKYSTGQLVEIVKTQPMEQWDEAFGFELGESTKLYLSRTPSSRLTDAVKRILNEVTNTGWTTPGHSAVDLPVYAYGVGADTFAIGLIDNTELGQKLLDLAK